ncbi:uncharacterized protein LOC110941011 isoform X1 [Helianthus annuus]|uniref:uncharacterized protein LOC110941011 isoform X1 n=1 Tax=Helianthus annuus TaxID=4232 RepID=UPI00165335E1|nr:uncharacterized protein LOC110941011 isoform X1 [Helianthus annuus]
MEERKMHWVAWDTVTRHIKDGGLGLNKLELVNRSLLTKWGWRFKTEGNNLWKKVIGALHSNRKGWECIPFKKSLPRVWNNIAKIFINTNVAGRPLRNFMKGSVGNGEEVAFWLDCWLLNEPLKTAFPELFRSETEKRCAVADRIKVLNGEVLFNWSWNSDLSSEGLGNSLDQLLGALTGMQITSGKDNWKWTSDPDGCFSVKNVKRLLKKDYAANRRFVVEWCSRLPSKVNIHGWRLEMNKVPTAEALMYRNIEVNDPSYPLCSPEIETADHLFIACFIASTVWNGVSTTWCKIPQIFAFSLQDLLSIYSDLAVSEKKKEAVQGIIMVSCWSLWRARNKFKFSNVPVKIEAGFHISKWH